MGGRLGTPVCSAADGKQGDSDYLDEKLADIIKKKAGRKEARSSSFNKLLLRFNHLDKGFTKCREVFHSLDVDGNNVIDLEELRQGCRKMGFAVNDDMIVKIFDASDLDGNRVVDFREFIVVLAILYMFSTEDQGHSPAGLDASIIKTFSLAEEAFTYFDASKDGFMDRSEVMAALKETGMPHKRGTKSQANVKGSSMNNILIKRFEEMDWDNNGQISFKEFLYAVQGWVLDDDDDKVDADSDEEANMHREGEAAKAAAQNRMSLSAEDSRAFNRRSSMKVKP